MRLENVSNVFFGALKILRSLSIMSYSVLNGTSCKYPA